MKDGVLQREGPFARSIGKTSLCDTVGSGQQSPHASVTSTHALKGVSNSKQKRLDNIALPKLLRTPCWRRYFFTATNDSSHIVSNHLLYHTQKHTHKHFFTASNGSSHIASHHLMHHTQGHVHSHFKHSSRTISCPQGISVTVIRTMPPSSSRCLAATRATCKESGRPHSKDIIAF